jgi:DNA-binding NarL/FixJ family response regulator
MEPVTLAGRDQAIRVLVVDADRRVRQSLCGLIDLAEGMEIAGSAADAIAAIEGLSAGPVDLVLLDPRLPEFDAGRALVAAIGREWPGTPVVALYWPDDHAADEVGRVTVLPATVQPDALVELLRSSAAQAVP